MDELRKALEDIRREQGNWVERYFPSTPESAFQLKLTIQDREMLKGMKIAVEE